MKTLVLQSIPLHTHSLSHTRALSLLMTNTIMNIKYHNRSQQLCSSEQGVMPATSPPPGPQTIRLRCKLLCKWIMKLITFQKTGSQHSEQENARGN